MPPSSGRKVRFAAEKIVELLIISFQSGVVAAEHFCRQIVLVVTLTTVFALLFGAGRGYGIPGLIYHPSRSARTMNGLFFGLLVFWISFIAHLDHWQDWTFQAQFRAEEWHTIFPHDVPTHVAYLLIYQFAASGVSLLLVVTLAVGLHRPRVVSRLRSIVSVGRDAVRKTLRRHRQRGVSRLRSILSVGRDWAWNALRTAFRPRRFLVGFLLGWLGGPAVIGIVATAIGLYRVTPALDLDSYPTYTPAPWPDWVRWVILGVVVVGIAIVILLMHRLPERALRLSRLLSPAAVFCLAVAVFAVLWEFTLFSVSRFAQQGVASVRTESDERNKESPVLLDNPVGLASVGFVGFILAVSFWARREYKIRLPGMEDLYAAPLDILSPVTATAGGAPAVPLIQMDSVLNAAAGRPMIVVAASGGGLTAAAWTVAVLRALEENIAAHSTRAPKPRTFPSAVRLITGSSGGMLGGAYYAAALKDGDEGCKSPSIDLVQKVGGDCLSRVVRTFAFHDLIWSLIPARTDIDRGRALEAAWAENLGGVLGSALGQRASDERSAKRPLLVFPPMMVETGQRLLITNLDCEWLEKSQPGSFEELFKWFPDAAGRVSLATAARLSASFPLISPVVTLPTNPARRVVDAGYFDNSGTHLAGAWVEQAIENGCTDPIALIEIRAFKEAPLSKSTPTGMWEPLFTPFEGLWAARKAVTQFRNEEFIARLTKYPRQQVRRFIFTCPAELPLNWYLSEDELQRLQGSFQNNTELKKTVEAFLTWWNQR